MSTKPTIVLVHGFWGGAAHWSKVIIELSRRGYSAIHAVEMPLTRWLRMPNVRVRWSRSKRDR